MGDKVSTFLIGLDGDAGDLNSVLAAFKANVRSAVADIKATTANDTLFENLGSDLQKTRTAFLDATAAVTILKSQIDSIKGAGGTVGQDLAAQMRLAENAATAASRAYNAQVTQLTALQTKLTAAGVNTGALASEQTRLATALKVATAAAAEQNAKGLLGFKSLDDVQPKITALTKAFDTLRLSGKLSATEIATAQELLQKKIAEVRNSVSTLGGAFSSQGDSIASFISSGTAKLLGLVAVVGSVGAAISSVIQTSRAFSQGIAEIGSVTELSKAELHDLGEGAKELAARIGIDVVEAVHQLKDLIRSGIDPDNALLVLAASAETAKASQQDLASVVKVGTLLLHGYGIEIGDLQKTFDILFQGMKDGGPTFNELAASLGPLLSVAKLAHVPIEELVASLQTMVRAGVPAEAAITALTKIISKVDTKAAVANLAALGIQADGLADLFEKVGASGQDLNQLLQLGLADKRSIAGLAALTSGAGALRGEIDKLKGSAGSAAVALEKLQETPKEKVEKLSASYQVLKVNIGEVAGESGGLIDLTTKLLNATNLLVRGNFDFAQTLALIATSGRSASAVLDALQRSTVAAAQGVKTAVTSLTGAVAQQIAAIDATITKLTGGIEALVANLQTSITASQAAASAAIADLNARAATQIAALDRSTAAEQATADATLAIQTKLAADRLDVIVKSAAQVLTAVEAEGAARLALARGNAEQTKTIEQSIAQAKLTALAGFKAQLTAELNDAIAKEQGYVAKVNSIDATRVSFNRDVQDKLSAIRNEGLSDFDAYFAKVSQINKLLADAATAFQAGGAAGLALGKTYTDQAIALSGTLKTVVNADGVAVISAFDLQQKKLELITKAAEQYNDALDDQKAAATQGKDASIVAISAVEVRLADITKQYDDLNTKVQAGLELRITTDEESITKALADLSAQLAEKAQLVPVQVDLQKLSKDVDDVVAKLKAGVTDGVNTQLDAIAANLVKIAGEAPELKLDTGPATTQIDALKSQVLALADLRPKLDVQSNVAEVQAAIDHLKLPTESTHTVHVVVEGGVPSATQDTGPVTGLAAGGPVGSLRRAGAAWRAYAGGGFAFPRLASARVPGSGSGDTVPASLRSGSFVVRKAASQYYGDGLMSQLALGALGVRFRASGGFTFGMGDRGLGTTAPDPQKLSFFDAFVAEVQRQTQNSGAIAPVIDPKKGYQSGDSFQGNLPDPITFDVRQVPASLVTAANVLAYAQEMLLRVGFNNPLLGALGDDLLAMMQAVQANAGDTVAIAQLLRDAETIGANPYIFSLIGKTQSSRVQAQPEWFYDWLEKTHAGELAGASASDFNATATSGASSISPAAISDFAQRFFGSPGFGESFYVQNPLATIKAFARGGRAAAGGDTVPAMLTPGEYVINAPRASQLGGDLLHALNSISVPREMLAAMIAPPAPRRPPMRFAEGGPVGDLWGGSGPQPEGRPLQVNFYLDGSDLLSEDQVRRKVVPILDDLIRRKR